MGRRRDSIGKGESGQAHTTNFEGVKIWYAGRGSNRLPLKAGYGLERGVDDGSARLFSSERLLQQRHHFALGFHGVQNIRVAVKLSVDEHLR